MSTEEIIEAVEQAKKPGKFKILDVLQDRGYPTEQVEVFLDEAVAYAASDLDDAIKELDRQLDREAGNNDAVDDLMKRRDEVLDRKEKLVEEMGGARYVFHLMGISEGKRQDLYDRAVGQFPIEYERDRNAFTGESDKKEIDNQERDRFFTTLLWEAHVTKIVAPDGSVQEGINFDEALELRRVLPLAATGAITEGIEKMRTATALFMMSVNEDFLAKS